MSAYLRVAVLGRGDVTCVARSWDSGALAIAATIVAIAVPAGPTVMAAARDVREVTPAGISTDGSRSDWDSPSADYLADMYEAGKPDKSVRSKLYARYDCATRTMYVLVITTTGWKILPSNADNYVKIGQTDKRVDGNDGPGSTPPAFAYVGNDDGVGGFTVVAVMDSPAGGSLPAGATAPPTDTVAPTDTSPDVSFWMVVGASVIGTLVAVIYLRRRATERRDRSA